MRLISKIFRPTNLSELTINQLLISVKLVNFIFETTVIGLIMVVVIFPSLADK